MHQRRTMRSHLPPLGQLAQVLATLRTVKQDETTKPLTALTALDRRMSAPLVSGQVGARPSRGQIPRRRATVAHP
jgi:hypothetical protein